MGVVPYIDISAGQRKVIQALFERHLPGTEAWAYGSRAKWTSRPQSDLDLVVFAKPEQTQQVGNLREAFEESDLPFRIDLFVWDEVPDSFREQIEAEHVVLVETKAPFLNAGLHEYNLGNLTDNFDYLRVPVKKADRKPGPYPYYGASGIVDYVDSYIFDGKYLLVAEDGENLRTRKTPIAFLADGKFWVNNHAHILRGNRKADTRFLSYALSQLDLGGYLTGSTMPKLTRNSLDQISLFVPRPEEQRAIANILGALDDKIELNRRMNETLEAMARTLFKSWFVNFDPVRAKMAGRDPGLPQPLVDLFPDRLVDSELGEIPEGWEVSMIGDEVNAVGGGTPNTREPAYWNGGIHNWATPKDLSRLASPVLLETERKITDAGVMKISSGLLPVGSVLLSSRAPIGYLAIAEQPVAINQGFIAMICENRLPNVFVLYWCYENLAHIRRIAGGSTFSEISKKVFRPILVAIPSRKILKVFEDVVSPLYDRIVTNTKEAELLAQTRDILLPRLVSGEIRLNDAERSLEAVL